jgi:hypothetical protein
LHALEHALASEDAGLALRGRLERYLPFLVAELEEERGERGLLGEVIDARPGFAHRGARVRALQDEVLAGLRSLQALLAEHSPEERVCLRARRALIGSIRALRRAEEALLLDAYFLDLGGEGC